MKATSYQLNSSDAARQGRPRPAPLPASTEPRGCLSLRVLTARRLLDLVALGIAPAAAGGLVAFAHTGHPAWGAIVAVSILVVNQLVSETRYPLHLMPVTRLVDLRGDPPAGRLPRMGDRLVAGDGLRWAAP